MTQTALSDAQDTTSVPAKIRGVPRRGAMRWLAGGGLGIIGSLASLAETRGAAASPLGLSSPCCNLASNTQCRYPSSGKCHYTCPTNYKRAVWGCSAGARWILCGECVPLSSPSCEVGPWPCSIWWDDATCI